MTTRPAAVVLSIAISTLAATGARAEPPDELGPAQRIQRRFVDKQGHLALYAGVSYLERSDFYRSPGLDAAASYYFLESLAAELRASYYWSSPTDELLAVREHTGYIPDSRPSRASVLGGVRLSLGYAKLRVGSSHILHFEPQAFLYGGIHIAGDEAAVEPLSLVGLGFLVHLTTRLQIRLDLGLAVGGEQRTTYVMVVGFHPTLSIGVRL